MLDFLNRHVMHPLMAAKARSRHLDYLRVVRQTQFDPPDVGRARQLAALKAQLQHAYDTVPYYRAAWRQAGVETFIYALYDRDAGGRRAARTVERELPEHAPGVPITFTLLGVTDEQVEDWQLPTRPAKKSDPEADKFDGRAVELDAIPPDKLIGLVENAIVEHVDTRSWAIEQSIEHEEREILYELARQAA